MKKILHSLLIYTSLLLTYQSYAQNIYSCDVDKAHIRKIQNDPVYKIRYEKLEKEIAKKKQSGLKASVNGIYRIPVVFHIITHSSNIVGTYPSAKYELYTQYNGSSWNRIQDQLNRLNTEFLDANIQFCLAQNAPPSYEGVSGVPGSWQELSAVNGTTITSTGVTYTINNNLSSFQSSNQAQVATLENVLPFNQAGENYYLDIYVVDNVLTAQNQSIGGEASYGIGSFFDDITVINESFGNLSNSSGYTMPAGANQGKLAVHEAGHWLLLKHVFANDQWCDPVSYFGMDGDHIAGTPPQLGPGNGCTSLNYTCSNVTGFYTNNHMDYLDDNCKVTHPISGVNPFVSGQNTRMENFVSSTREDWHAVLNRINTGIESSGCIPNYTPQIFTAEFDMDQNTVCEGDNIQLVGMSVSQLPAGATIIDWSFTITEINNVVSPQTITSTGNQVVFALLTTGGLLPAGTYSIALTVNYIDNGISGSTSYANPQTILVEDCSASSTRFIKSFDYEASDLTDLAIVSTSSDDGYIISGTNNISQNQKRIVVFKVNLLGEIIWEWEFQDPNGSDNARSFDIIHKKGYQNVYLISGYCNGTGGNKEALVLEIKDFGTTCAQNGIGALHLPIQFADPVAGMMLKNSIAVEIINTSDGGFAIAGVIASGFNETDPKNQLLIKLNSNMSIQWIEQYNFSQLGDSKDFDFANSVVELTNYNSNSNQFQSAYFLGGAKNKRVQSLTGQGVSSLIIEDAAGTRDITNPNNNSWGTVSASYDHGMDVIYDAQENMIYQKTFTRRSHGLLVAKIDPYTGNIVKYFESNLLSYGEEYLALKMIASNNGQDIIMTGYAPSNGIKPCAMKLSKSGWASFGTIGTGTINNVLFREYNIHTINPSTAGPDFPVVPPNGIGAKQFFYSPKSICRSPNGGYMYVNSGVLTTFSNTGTSLNLLKLDEDLKIGCGTFTTMDPDNQFSPIQYSDFPTQSGLASNRYVLNMHNSQNIPSDCGNFCFGNFTIDACDFDEDGFTEFDLNSSLIDFTGSGYTYNWFSDPAMTNPITNVTSYLAAEGTVVYLFIQTPDFCSTTIDVTLEFIEPPVVSVNFSIQASTSGTFNLTAAQLQNIGTGYSVQWFSDLSFTQVINNLSSYIGPAGTSVYAIIEGTSCEWTIEVKLIDCVNTTGQWPKYSITSNNKEYITDIVSDQNGNIYITGIFGGAFEFMGTMITEQMASNENFFIAKFNSCSLEWIHMDNSTGLSKGTGIDVDASGNVYVTGQYKNMIDLGNAVILSTTGDYQGFTAKYSSSGAVQWIKPLNLNNNYSHAYDVAVDQVSGNIYVTGLQQSQNGTNHNQYMLVKYSPSGNQTWVVTDANGPSTYGWAVDVDNLGNVVMTGVVQGTGTVNLGSLPLTTNVQNQAMIAKFNSNGSGLNVAQNEFEPGDIKADDNGNIFVIASHDASGFNFNGSSHYGVVALVKYNSTLTEVWARVGTSTISQAYPKRQIGSRLSISPSGDVFVVGVYRYNLTLGSLPTLNTTLGSSINNYYTAKYNTSGTEQWAVSVTPNLSSVYHHVNSPNHGFLYPPIPVCITHDGDDHVYLASRFAEIMTLGSTILQCSSAVDVFIARIEDMGTTGGFLRKKELELGEINNSAIDLIEVYPNPSKGVFQIKWDEGKTEINSFYIVNMQGKVVLKVNTFSSEKDALDIDLSNLANGIYFLSIKTNNGSFNRKLLLNK
ncbi:MAG: T9SS type A sorting domain-containing protein [Flavobacteriales bacterium]|nr:T9SS type A sorting domain-containing protein [Flavobacteriales bacterium]